MQREKPGISPAELAGCFGRSAIGVLVSGGQFENFREGWAKPIMGNSIRAHWFRRESFNTASALCGHESPVRWLYGPGNYQKCSRCDRIVKRHRLKGGQ